MFDLFYNVMIRPVEYLIEIIFTVMYSLLGHEGYTLIGMSIAVSTLVLPLYARAEAIQEEEREKQKSMERWMGAAPRRAGSKEPWRLMQPRAGQSSTFCGTICP